MGKLYEVLFYSGDGIFPAYYLINGIESETIERGLEDKLASITQRVREMFGFCDDIPDWKVHEALYVLQEGGLISIKSITPDRRGSRSK
jgi:hypothetical protein